MKFNNFLFLWLISTNLVHATETLKPKMQQMRQALQSLLSIASSEERFNAPQNTKQIEEDLKLIASLSHNLKTSKVEDSDPSLKLIASVFKRESQWIERHFQNGRKEYARKAVQSMSQYCIACHTRVSGIDFKFDDSNLTSVLKGLDLPKYYSATRQFDLAIQHYQKLVNDPIYLKTQIFNWEKALQAILSIQLRVKKDPTSSIQTIQKVLSLSTLPSFMKEQLESWLKDLKGWKVESDLTQREPYWSSIEKSLKDAQFKQDYPQDRSADILYFKANTMLHEYLKSASLKDPHRTEAIYNLGKTYEVLREIDVGDLHQFYYLSCIDESPHTALSQKCFDQYEKNLYQGYTGSQGTELPEDIAKELKVLRERSKPIAKKSANKVP